MLKAFGTYCFLLRKDNRGQSTVEAVFIIPLLLVLLLLLVQPGILLYNLMVMQGAASEGCRLLATGTEVLGSSTRAYEEYILYRLGSIPPQDNFHLHGGACTWEIELQGDETSQEVTVRIRNKLKPLPLLDMGATLLGMCDASGSLSQEVEVSMPTQPAWVAENDRGFDPKGWVEQWR